MDFLQREDLEQGISFWKSRINNSIGCRHQVPREMCISFISPIRLQPYWNSWLSHTFYSILNRGVFTELNSKHVCWTELIIHWFNSTYIYPDSQCVNYIIGMRKGLETCINFCWPLGYHLENYSFHGWNELISCQIERNVFSPCCQQINVNACGKGHWAHSVSIIFDQSGNFIKGYCKQVHN